MKSDIQIAQETKELPITEIASHVGLNSEDLEPYRPVDPEPYCPRIPIRGLPQQKHGD